MRPIEDGIYTEPILWRGSKSDWGEGCAQVCRLKDAYRGCWFVLIREPGQVSYRDGHSTSDEIVIIPSTHLG